jgi:transposase
MPRASPIGKRPTRSAPGSTGSTPCRWIWPIPASTPRGSASSGTRLIAGSAEQTLLDALLEHFRAKGLLKARGRQRTDSTAVLAAIRALNRSVCVGETLRHALNSLAVAAPEWLCPHLEPAWAERYGPRFDEYRLPKGDDARQQLAEEIGADGLRLLQVIYAAASPSWLRDLPAVAALRRVWVQQYHAPVAAGLVRWRAKEDLPPAARMINSPHDPKRATPTSAAPLGSVTKCR